MLNEPLNDQDESSWPKQSQTAGNDQEKETNSPNNSSNAAYKLEETVQTGYTGYYEATGSNQWPGYQPPVYYNNPKKRSNKLGSTLKNLTLALLLAIAGLAAFFFITNTGNSTSESITVPAASVSTAASSVNTELVSATSSATTGTNLSVQQVVEKVRPAVVQITSQQTVSANSPLAASSSQSASSTEDTGVGSGVIYDKAGYILTNNHVVEGADSLLVTLTDGQIFSGTVVGTDPATDLAVVKIDPGTIELPVAELGDSSALQVGDGLVAIGNALALEGGPTVTTGVVSALNRSVSEPATQSASGGFNPNNATIAADGTQLYGLIQTDAAINPGNSGGPLVNMQGQVVGINTLAAGEVETGVQAEGIGFAISSNQAKDIARQLVANGKVDHAMLGITSQALTPATAKSLGVSVTQGTVVVQIQSGSAAAQAGLKQGDVITAIDGQKLTDESTLGEIINAHKPGDKVELEVITSQANGGSGQARTVEVTLGSRSAA
jgi:S1-C subfamily serine protease